MSAMATQLTHPCLHELYDDRARLDRIISRRYSRRMSHDQLAAAWAQAREARIQGSRPIYELGEWIYNGRRSISPELHDAIDRDDTTATRRLEAKILTAEYGFEVADLYAQVDYRLERVSSLEASLGNEAARRLASITADWPRTSIRPEAST